VQLRTLHGLARNAELRAAFDNWVRDIPSSATPYREYARLLLQKNQSAAAQLQTSLHHEPQALALWRRIVDAEPLSPEAPQAELEWARILRRTGDTAAATAHLEHLILAYPQSSLVPQARRELELAKNAIPPTG
jgi:TolA-binding protein